MSIRSLTVALALGPSLCALLCSVAHAAPFPGASGMAKLDDSHYLCVQDVKAHSDKPRLAILSVEQYYKLDEDALKQLCKDGGNEVPAGKAELGLHMDYAPLDCDWSMAEEGRSSDLESVHAIIGRPGEFLAAESGYWQGQFGRVFHLKVSGQKNDWKCELLDVMQLPPELNGEVEGLVAKQLSDGSVVVMLGIRGGATAYGPARIVTGYVYGPEQSPWDLNFDAMGNGGTELAWPVTSWAPFARHISDMYLDSADRLWIAAAEDNGNAGPFRSFIFMATDGWYQDYPVGTWQASPYFWEIDGVKIEAIAAPSTPGSVLCYATDDEDYGGIWRPLPPAMPLTPAPPAPLNGLDAEY